MVLNTGNMSRQCQLLGKKTATGNNRPFSLKATRRTFRINLFTKRVFNPFTGRMEKMKLSAKAIRTLKKWDRELALEIQNQEAQKSSENITDKKPRVVKEKKLTPKQKKEQAAKEQEAKSAEKKGQENVKVEK